MGTNRKSFARNGSFSGTTALVWLAPLIGAQLLACNAFDEKQETPIGKSVRIVPTDERAVEEPSSPPPPITGGTMLTLGQDANGLPISLVADPDRDRLTLTSGGEAQHIELERGDQPFRITRDGSGTAYVVLRGSGQVAKIDVTAASVAARIDVCATPRGIDYDTINDQLLVACAEGKLVTVSPSSESVVSELVLEPDLRDVVVQGERTYVSRFRTAEVLFIESGEVVRRVSPRQIDTTLFLGVPGPDGEFEKTRTLQPEVAWRMIGDPQGGVLIAHQRAVVDPVGVDPHDPGDDDDEFVTEVSSSPYGGSASPFNTGPDCSAIVQSAVTSVAEDGTTRSTFNLAGLVLPVDIAVSRDSQRIAVASAGLLDPEMPRQTTKFIDDPDFDGDVALVGPAPAGASTRGGVAVINRAQLMDEQFFEGGGACAVPATLPSGPATSVAFDDNGEIMIHERQPATLTLLNVNTRQTRQLTELGGEAVRHTGHEIFHRDSGGGLACASCHPEATDDGHVWVFEGFGERKTQHVGIPLKNTAPFHWDGSLPNLDQLMDEIFAQRMGGVFQSPDRLDALQGWMFAREAPVLPVEDADAVQRGKELFHSTETTCATCHAGDDFTDNLSYDVGTSDGVRLQVPPLRGLALHPPYMHNGCAKTLEERFSEGCGGGDLHGRTSQLSADQIGDLISYLKTL